MSENENDPENKPIRDADSGRLESSDHRFDEARGLEPDSIQSGQLAPASENAAAVKPKSELWEWTKALVIAFVLAFLIRHFLFGSYIVDGPSMKPNFQSGERLIVNKLLYDLRDPKRGEVVVFHATAEKDYIKRIVGLPGETVSVQGDTVYIDGIALDEPYLKEVVEEAKAAGKSYNRFSSQEVKVPEGAVFVMGDNRSDSTDSRMIGSVTFDKIVGRSDIVFWPIREMKWIN